MPKAAELPDSIAKLSRRHAMKMSDEQFRADATRLIERIQEHVTEKSAESSPVSDVPEGMVLIPKGPFWYGEDRVRREIPNDYYMDVYLVTNDQYNEFMLANGYGSKKYWSDEGWTWKKKKQVNRPDIWTDSEWNIADHPVVGVSWYEAEAYAKWADKRLPSEEEWEKAARGTEGREYPWGDEFDKEKCNSEASGYRKTTSVTKYVNGLSPYGCYDMAGNVWEWCASWDDQSRLRPVVRGGSWADIPEFLRASVRGRDPIANRGNYLGFRLAQGTP